jgi:hypothetical protein
MLLVKPFEPTAGGVSLAVVLRVRPETSCSCSCPPEADDRIGQMDEGEIVAGMNFIANLQAAEKVMPTVRPLDHPAVSFLPSPPRGRCNAAIGNVGNVTSPLCRESDVLKVITLIAAQMLLDVSRRSPVDDERVQRRPETSLIMDVGSRESYPKRDSLAIDNEVTFRAELSSIGRVFARFIPPFTGAETVTLSSDCHSQSMPLQRSYSSKQSLQSLENPPALVHFWKCSWAAEPEPYSRGSIFHWHPVLRTYKIPLKIVRWGVGGRPPLGERACLGKMGSTLAQNSSETSRQPGLRGNGFRDLEFRAMAGSSNEVAKIFHLHYNQSGSPCI